MANASNWRALSASTLIGDEVVNTQGEKLGKIEDIMLDLERGRVAYAVLSFGGFLGMGDKFFAVPWDQLDVDLQAKNFRLDVPKEKLEQAPGFDKDNWPDTVDPTFVGQVYEYYGTPQYW
ncbi:MAG: PRC-barrel domain-containing protein [Vicinamibacterales bacterium]